MNKHGQHVIAIDGSSASGKSTLSERLAADYRARRLEYSAFFRLIAAHMLHRGFTPGAAPATAADIAEAARYAASLTSWETIEAQRGSHDLNTIEISRTAPYFSGERAILDATDATLRALIDASRGPVVAEGRTIGKYVYPEADVKLYIDAALPSRAARRGESLRAKGRQITDGEVASDLQKRDTQDQTRPYQPTFYDPAHHLLIDNTHHSIEESLAAARRHIEAACPGIA